MNNRKLNFTLNEEQKKLVEDNHNLIYKFLRSKNYPIEEFYDLAAIGLCYAAYSYNPEKSKFSTYAFYRMKGFVGKEFRHRDRKSKIPDYLINSYEEEISNNNNNNFKISNIIKDKNVRIEEDTEFGCLAVKCFYKLKDYEQKVIVLLSRGYTQKEVSKIVNKSQPQISRIKIKFKNLIKNENNI